MQVQDWLGADNELGISIWEQKYRNSIESFDEWLDRVSGGSYAVRGMIVKKKFLFGGRILANRGLTTEDKKLTYSNCYVLAPPEDNLESIFETAKKLARTFSYGGAHGRSLEASVAHFHEKLLKLKDLMNTETAKALAEKRHAFLLAFLEELQKETDE